MTQISNLCRICLAPEENEKFTPIFKDNGELARQIFTLTNIIIYERNDISAVICEQCKSSLQLILELKKSAVQAEIYFEKLCEAKELKDTEFVKAESVTTDRSPEKRKKSKKSKKTKKKTDKSSISEADKNEPPQQDPVYNTRATSVKQEPVTNEELDHDFNPIFDQFGSDDSNLPEDDIGMPAPETILSDPDTETRFREDLHELICAECGYTAADSGDLQEHLEAGHVKDLSVKRKRSKSTFSCGYCPEKFTNAKDVSKHHKKHAKEMLSCDCRYCGKHLLNAKTLRFHIKTIHLEKQYKCPKCGKEFGNSQLFEDHMRAENNIRCFVCEICGKSYYSRTILFQHMQTHIGVRQHKCDHCDMSFYQKYRLKKHMNVVHLKILPFECFICKNRFANKFSLELHLKNEVCVKKIAKIQKAAVQKQTGVDKLDPKQKVYHCWMCNLPFGQKSNLKRHVNTVHFKSYPYKCEVCNKVFSTKFNLETHLKRACCFPTIQSTYTEQLPENC